jgi:hypothetical protein
MCRERDSYLIQDLMGCCLDRMAVPPSTYSPLPHSLINHNHGLIKYIDTKAKCCHPKKIYLQRAFAAGVYQSFQTGDTVRHVGIFRPSIVN